MLRRCSPHLSLVIGVESPGLYGILAGTLKAPWSGGSLWSHSVSRGGSPHAGQAFREREPAVSPRVARRLLLVGLLTTLGLAQACQRPPTEPSPPPSPTVASLVGVARAALERRDYDAAVDAYRQALSQTPWNTRLSHALAAAYAGRAAYARDVERAAGLPSAEADLRKALVLRPGEPSLRRNLARVLVERAAWESDPERVRRMRAEARSLAPELLEAVPPRAAALERRVDLAFDLIERGQLVAGIERLEAIRAEHPEHVATLRLLARAQVRYGAERSAAGDARRAGEALGRAVELYRGLDDCRSGLCERQELELAHRNRAVLWLNAGRQQRARRALADARRAGLDLADLARVLGDPPHEAAP